MSRPRLVHLTTTDISLELLLGPQLSAFVDAGYEVIGVSAPGPFVRQIEARGVRHIPLTNATRAMAPHKDLLAVGELTRLFRGLRPDIVHTHNPKPGLYGRIAARAAGVPVVVNTVHGLYALPGDEWKKRALVYSLERVAATCSDAELVQNPEDLVTLRNVLHEPASKLTLLGNGIDLSRFGRRSDREDVRAKVRAELGVDESTTVVGAVGRLVLEKGYVELLDAWGQVSSEHPGAVLVVVGPTDEDKADSLPADVMHRARAAGVRFLGMRDDVEELYLGMDLYVLASHREGFPRSAMEAAASGLPIVATDIRGCRQVVDDGTTGLLVPVRDAAGLHRAIARLIGDAGLRADMSAAAARRATEEFDQQSVIDITLATYDRLRRRRPSATATAATTGEVVPGATGTASGGTGSGSDAPYRGKRALDLALLALVAGPSLVVGAVCAAAVAATSRGPVFFRQERIGKDGVPFRVWKFRTMVDDDNPIIPDPTRITRVGAVLRRLSLDELPQLINVATGDMSVVGPRPTLAYQVERYDDRQARRLAVRPGLTGLAQVSGRNALPWAERIELDVEYVERQSPATDLRLVARTLATVISGEGVEGHAADDPLASTAAPARDASEEPDRG